IDEAIKRLERQIGLTSPTIEPYLIETYKLSIEALKRFKETRRARRFDVPRLLPGETIEKE
ncbi:unnamed protein product, partial [marine sediment metagenome]